MKTSFDIKPAEEKLEEVGKSRMSATFAFKAASATDAILLHPWVMFVKTRSHQGAVIDDGANA